MQEKNSVVEEALIQMKQVEEAISENAKGILASTMKEEINQLVKESLSEQDDEEEKTDVDMDMEMDMDTDNEDEMDMDTEMDVDVEDMDTDMEMDMDMDSDETPIDLTHASDEEILKVFKAMGEDDGIIVKKDGTNVTLKDNTTDSEYLVKLGESKSKRKINEMYEEDETDIDDVIESLFSDSETTDEEMDEAMYEIHMNDDMGQEMEETMYEVEMDEEYEEMDEESEEMDEEYEEMDEESEEMDETIYEIVMDEESEEMDEESEEMDEASDEEFFHVDESYSHKKAKKGMKPKGMGMGKPKFSYKKSTGGFKEDMKQGTKGVGMGKAKFEYKEGKNMDGKSKLVKKTETKEAARTYGMGSKEGRGLKKRNYS
jgi:hypothetical protein